MALATNLGFPRMGAKRELKKALESYWAKDISQEELKRIGSSLRLTHWKLQKEAGIHHIPSNDFTYYDHVLSTAAMVGAVPERYSWKGVVVDLDTFFAMARGNKDVPAMEMTKWFDTNYHYIVPEFSIKQTFQLSCLQSLEHFKEAKSQGILTRPVFLGPVSFLLLGKIRDGEPLSLLDTLLPVYAEILSKLVAEGAEWVQMDEPCFVLDQTPQSLAAARKAYEYLAHKLPTLKILFTTYFGELAENLKPIFDLPVSGVHLDLHRAPHQLESALKCVQKEQIISLGIVDGRNIWRTDLTTQYSLIEKAIQTHGAQKIFLAPSCSLLHTPVDLDQEKKLDPELKSWLSFSKQKLQEVALLTKAANKEIVSFSEADQALAARRLSPRIHNTSVRERMSKITSDMMQRKKPFSERVRLQRKALNLPLYPTTTIGSFPQTPEIRAKRAEFKAGNIDQNAYNNFLRQEIAHCVKIQEELGIDVFVHGEAERNDMVEYFGEQLSGYAFSQFGWVQSYGSRCVKPPILFGDVSRPYPMTVEWSSYAQSLTRKPMKGMLTGPVTILQWSFVRDDQPRSETARQLALALRDEVRDLERAGIKVIQIDEPAVREGLPLRRKDWKEYLQWAVDAFRLSASGVADETQVHTHMCYAQFNDIIEAVAALDADVISIETSRSQMELLDAFVSFKYPNEIGPGVYDIHSPRVVPQEEMEALLRKASAVLRPDQIWVNPDCGLKTRKWEETKKCLRNMVAAAHAMRQKVKAA